MIFRILSGRATRGCRFSWARRPWSPSRCPPWCWHPCRSDGTSAPKVRQKNIIRCLVGLVAPPRQVCSSQQGLPAAAAHRCRCKYSAAAICSANRCSAIFTAAAIRSCCCRAMLRAAYLPRRRENHNKSLDDVLLWDLWCAGPIRAARVPAPRGAA